MPTRPVRSLSAARFCLACAAGLLLGACGGGPERPEQTEAELRMRGTAGQQAMTATFDQAVTKVLARLERLSAGTEPGDQTLDLLAMSGGGDYGAFGAGVLVGWGEMTDPALRRPDLEVVTGVSAGALLGPFAYLGTSEACAVVEHFYNNPKPDWFATRGLIPFWPSNPSFMTWDGAQKEIRGTLNAAFIERLAAESRKGKVLAISATDLDFGRQQFWDLGAEAEAALITHDYERVQNIVLASASIPGVFEPTRVGDGYYVDGGVTANVFLRLDADSPRGVVGRWRAAHPDKPLPKMRYWIIVNNQRNAHPKTVQIRWPDIAGPSLSTSIRSATWTEVRWLAAEADYANAMYGTNIEVRVIAIPDEWTALVPGDFQQENMRSLTALGRTLGADPGAWQLIAAPKARAAK